MITDRIEFVNNHTLFLGAMLGTLMGMAIREEEDLDDFLSKAYATYPKEPGYTAVIKSLDDATFDKIVESITDVKGNFKLDHIKVLEGALLLNGAGMFSELVNALYFGITLEQLEKRIVH